MQIRDDAPKKGNMTHPSLSRRQFLRGGMLAALATAGVAAVVPSVGVVTSGKPDAEVCAEFPPSNADILTTKTEDGEVFRITADGVMEIRKLGDATIRMIARRLGIG